MSVNGQAQRPQIVVFGSDRAPEIYFDGVHSCGELFGIYQLELFTVVNIACLDNKVTRRQKAAAHLRCTEAGLRQIIACAEAALKMPTAGNPPPKKKKPEKAVEAAVQ